MPRISWNVVDVSQGLRNIERIAVNIVIGTPIYRQGAYVVDKFMSNQKQIQQSYPSSNLILATSEYAFIKELESLVSFWKLRGTVLLYEVVKPDHARSSIWNIACGREAIREYTLSQTEVGYLLFLDADMTFDPSVVNIMKKEIQGYDVVFSGYPLKRYGMGLAGMGCVMLTRSILEKVKFRCYEFKNGELIFEDNLLEMDLFRLGSRSKKGFFLSINHCRSATEARHITPQPVGIFRKIANCAFIRYVLLSVSIMIQLNIPWNLKVFLNKLFNIRMGKPST
ncbi:glycosyltransferase family A protein [Chloroflexota bacterium]